MAEREKVNNVGIDKYSERGREREEDGVREREREASKSGAREVLPINKPAQHYCRLL